VHVFYVIFVFAMCTAATLGYKVSGKFWDPIFPTNGKLAAEKRRRRLDITIISIIWAAGIVTSVSIVR
jgi:hypothetical protein